MLTRTCSVGMRGGSGGVRRMGTSKHLLGGANVLAGLSSKSGRMTLKVKAAAIRPGDERSDKENLDLLSFCNGMELLRDLRPAQQLRLMAALVFKTYEPGQDIYKAGDPADHIYIVAEGGANRIEKGMGAGGVGGMGRRTGSDPGGLHRGRAPLSRSMSVAGSPGAGGGEDASSTPKKSLRRTNSSWRRVGPSGSDEAPKAVAKEGELLGEFYGVKAAFGDECLTMPGLKRSAPVRAGGRTSCLVLSMDDLTSVRAEGLPRAVQAKVDFLKQVPVLRGLSTEEVAMVSSTFKREVREKGAVLAQVGQQGETVYLVVRGECSCVVHKGMSGVEGWDEDEEWVHSHGFRKLPKRRSVVVCTLGPRSFVGEESAVLPEKRNRFTIVAASQEVELLSMPAAHLNEVFTSELIAKMGEAAEIRGAFVVQRANEVVGKLGEAEQTMATPRGGAELTPRYSARGGGGGGRAGGGGVPARPPPGEAMSRPLPASTDRMQLPALPWAAGAEMLGGEHGVLGAGASTDRLDARSPAPGAHPRHQTSHGAPARAPPGPPPTGGMISTFRSPPTATKERLSFYFGKGSGGAEKELAVARHRVTRLMVDHRHGLPHFQPGKQLLPPLASQQPPKHPADGPPDIAPVRSRPKKQQVIKVAQPTRPPKPAAGIDRDSLGRKQRMEKFMGLKLVQNRGGVASEGAGA